jgi:hypothetical protein
LDISGSAFLRCHSIAGFDVSQVWRRSRAADPAHLWLRERIKQLALEVASPEFPLRKEDR